jgi:Na+/H+ antiporter NhaC
MLQPFDPYSVVLIAALNPAVILVGFMMGRQADQWQKLIVAGFVAALAGAVLVWFGAFFGLLPARGVGGETGSFVAAIVFGTVWAALGFGSRRIWRS